MNIVWFKRDLRLIDHQPLAAAIDQGEPLLLLYIIEPMLIRDAHYRGRHWHFIAQSLNELNQQLQPYGTTIQVLEGEAETLLRTLHQHLPIKQLFSHAETGLSLTFDRDRRVMRFCTAEGIRWQEFQSNGVQRGRADRRGWNRAWHQVMGQPLITTNLNRLRTLHQPLPEALMGAQTSRLADWDAHKPDFQRGGTQAASSVLSSFLDERAQRYQMSISKPEASRHHCSRLSPHLAWGNLSLRQAYHALKHRQSEGQWGRALGAFESRLHWHCHFIQKFEMECRMECEDLNRGYLDFPRRRDPERLGAWR